MSQARNRYRLALTPSGAGVLTLFFPGLLVAVASAQQALVALSLGAAIVLGANALWVLLSLRSLSVEIGGPVTATTGASVPLTVVVAGPRRLECGLGLEGGVRTWLPAQLPGQGEVRWRAERRGVLDRVTVRIQSSVPLGLTAVVRRLEVPLGLPIHIAPPAQVVSLPIELAGEDRADLAAGRSDPVGLRPYQAGDGGRDIHWPTVARTATMMVKDRGQAVAGAELTVMVVVNRPDDVEQVLGWARGALERLLQAGYDIKLTTLETDDVSRSPRRWARRQAPTAGELRMVSAGVRGRDDVIKRLARVAVGSSAVGSSAVGGGRLGLVIDHEGLRWVSLA